MKTRRCEECGRMTLWISWSSLRSHEACSMNTRLVREGKKSRQTDIRVFFPGTVTDRVSRDWLRLDDPRPGQMDQMVGDLFDQIKDEAESRGERVIWKNKDDRNQVIRDCREAVTILEKDLMKYVLPFDYQPDYRFRVPIMLPHPHGGHGEVILNGALDVLVRDRKQDWAIWDVKHTRDSQYWRKVTGQINFYSLVIRMQYDRLPVIGGLLQPLCRETVKRIDVIEEDTNYLLQRVAAMARDIWAGDYQVARTSEPCTFCPTKHACPKFAPTERADGSRVVSLLPGRA